MTQSASHTHLPRAALVFSPLDLHTAFMPAAETGAWLVGATANPGQETHCHTPGTWKQGRVRRHPSPPDPISSAIRTTLPVDRRDARVSCPGHMAPRSEQVLTRPVDYGRADRGDQERAAHAEHGAYGDDHYITEDQSQADDDRSHPGERVQP